MAQHGGPARRAGGGPRSLRRRRRRRRLGVAGAATPRRRCRPRAATPDRRRPVRAHRPPGTAPRCKVGYSAWPGWFPLAVAEEQGIFEQAGVDVELTFFADYIASLDALVAGSIDVNTQTLNDTIFGVAAGSQQRIFLTNDNSTGNDAIICDASIGAVGGPRREVDRRRAGRRRPLPAAAGPRRGRPDARTTSSSRDCRRRRPRRRSPAGSSTASACSPRSRPRRWPARARTCCSARRTSRARSPTTSSPRRPPPRSTPTSCRSSSTPGTSRSTGSRPTRRRRRRSWPRRPSVTPEEYAAYAEGTTIFDAAQALDSFEDRAGRPDVAARDGPPDQPVPRVVGPHRAGGRPHRPVRPRATPPPTSTRRRMTAAPPGVTGSRTATGGERSARRGGRGHRSRAVRRSPRPGTATDRPAPRRRRPAAGASTRSGASAARSSMRWRVALGAVGVVGDPRRCGCSRPPRLDDASSFLVPTPAATWDALVGDVARRHAVGRPDGVAAADRHRLRDLGRHRRRASAS